MVFRHNQTHFLNFLLILFFVFAPMNAWANSAPVVSNVQAAQRPNSFIVDITYDLFDPDDDWMWVYLFFSPDGGSTWPIVCKSVSGDVGAIVTSGVGLSIEWDSEADFPDQVLASCSIRVIANDESPYPYIGAFWKSDINGGNEIPFTEMDTLGIGEPFGLRWQGVAPSIMGMDPEMLLSLDTVIPYDDGLLGYKYYIPSEGCDPQVEDCWRPAFFNEATGDSISYFSPVSRLDFFNDGSGPDPFHMILPSGFLEIHFNTLDVAGWEILPQWQDFHFVVNFDPETIILDGQSDWAHPEDPEIYPYYFLLNDPQKNHHPFQAGDRIPDRSYVVVKALGRDDSRDNLVDPNHEVGISGFLQGTRDNLFGGSYSFQTESSALSSSPTWPATCDSCWSADTLGFLTGPRTTFTINMQSVDEHGRRDGTPAGLSFEVGYPPCLQCIEILPKTFLPSAFDETLPCLADTSAGSIAAHPCFGDTTALRVTNNGLGSDDLEFIQPAYMLVDKISGDTHVVLDPGQGGDQYYEINVSLYRMKILLHGLDDYRERWDSMDRRMMGWAYQVDYECDPFNQIQDGGGNDDISTPTWGETNGIPGLEIEYISGLWLIYVDVAVPNDLMTLGPDLYRDIALQYVVGIDDPEIRDRVFNDSTKQFGAGRVRTIAMDQTQCGFFPVRPARYNIFRYVRPSVANLPADRTWRDCDLRSNNIVPDIMEDIDLSLGSMESLDGAPVSKYFRIIVETATGDFECQAPAGF
jgi:hypothetical protein